MKEHYTPRGANCPASGMDWNTAHKLYRIKEKIKKSAAQS